MASSRQLKHHSQFRGAVIRNLFLSSTYSSPSSTSQNVGVSQGTIPYSDIQIDSSAEVDRESFGPAPLSIPSHDEEIYLQQVHQMLKSRKNLTHNCFESEESETRKLFSPRAQQKKQRLKGLEGSVDERHNAKRFLGPLLPDSVKRQTVSNCVSACHKNIDSPVHFSDRSDLQQQESDVCYNVGIKDDTNHSQEENSTMRDKCDNISACDKNRKPHLHYSDSSGLQGGDVCDIFNNKIGKVCCAASQEENATTEVRCNTSGSISKNKRRRLAKKHLSGIDKRYPPKSIIFSAEIQGENIVLKKMIAMEKR